MQFVAGEWTVWRGLVCCTNTQPQLIYQDVQTFITFSQQMDFIGYIDGLLSRHTVNKQIVRIYNILLPYDRFLVFLWTEGASNNL